LQLQFGQSLQQSLEQHAPSLQVAGVAAVLLLPATLAAARPAANNKPPNNLTIIDNSLS
jgi:hypothetical protein